MRARIHIPAALMLGGFLAACSKPASQNNQKIEANAGPGARDIGLVEAPHPDAPVVSSLEAGLALKPALVRRAVRTKADPKPALTTAKVKSAALAAVAPTLSLSRTSNALSEAPRLLALAAAPIAVAPAPVAPAFGDGRSWRRDGAAHPDQPEGRDRGPAIIIRGGRGGADDHCDLHGRGGRGGGIAINQVAPPLEGGTMVTDHLPRFGGVRPGMPSSFPRGGIR